MGRIGAASCYEHKVDKVLRISGRSLHARLAIQIIISCGYYVIRTLQDFHIQFHTDSRKLRLKKLQNLPQLFSGSKGNALQLQRLSIFIQDSVPIAVLPAVGCQQGRRTFRIILVYA